MECAPTAKVDVENDAFPLTRVTELKTVNPFLNVTVPVGVAVAGETGATVTVKVRDWPNTDGLCEELTDEVEVAALFTVCDSADEVLVPKVALPE
jgi:hypothetical protein